MLPLVFDAPRRAMPPRHLADLDVAGRREAVEALGEKGFRAEQLSRHYFGGHTPEQMTDLPTAVREKLTAELLPTLLTSVKEVSCDDGATRKTLWKGHDGTLVESVLMRYADRTTICVSSQAGCGMACPFCATGQAGLTRNLSTGEIVEQVVDAQRTEALVGGRVTNAVFMGMGEPMANYNRVIGAVRRMVDPSPHGLGMAQRNIVISTVGLVPAIEKLGQEGLQVTLALSLHAPDDELRNTLVPVNTRWPVGEVLASAFGYTRTTGRRLSIEYAMIKNVNDQPERAHLLARRIKGKLVHVNLIPLNPTPGSEWDASSKTVEREFVRILREAGISTTVRETRGREIAGACGQLSAAEQA